MILRSLLVLMLLVASAHAEKPRVLVLPVTGQGVDSSSASAFDARLLVALEDTRRITTVTLDEELDCTTAKCLADAATAAQAQAVLSMSLVREAEGLTLFATLLDARTGQTSRRVELTPLSANELAATAFTISSASSPLLSPSAAKTRSRRPPMPLLLRSAPSARR